MQTYPTIYSWLNNVQYSSIDGYIQPLKLVIYPIDSHCSWAYIPFPFFDAGDGPDEVQHLFAGAARSRNRGEKTWPKFGFMDVYGKFCMALWTTYPLVKVYMTIWNITIFFSG